MSLALKKSDTVMVISGREKGKTGKIIRLQKEVSRALVEKLNLVRCHIKPGRSKAQPNGGIIEKEAGIHLSNLMYYCSKCAKPVRLGVKLLKDGRKARSCRKCGEMVDKVK